MVAYTPNKGYSLPTVAGDLNQWGVFLNQGTSILDNNMGGQAVVNVAGSSDVTATTAQAQNLVQSLTGVLTGNISYLLPNVGSFYIINNATTGAFTVTVKTTGGGSVGPVVPQNTQLAVYSRGGNVWIMDGGSTGGTINNRTFRGAVTIVSGGLTVSSGGAAITGNSTVSGYLSVTDGLSVSAFGAAINGDSIIYGTLTVSPAGASGNQVVNYSQFAPTFGSRTLTMLLPGSVRRQSGSTLVNTDGSGNATINFPTVFGAVDPTIVVQNGDATLTQTPVYLIGQNASQFQVVCPGCISSTYRVNWTAEGAA
jgi:hypothetical protein